MALKQYKPNTPGQRGLVLVYKSDLYKGKPVKKLTEGINKSGGRNNSGKITMWHRGGGHKRRYRIIDFKRTKLNVLGNTTTLRTQNMVEITLMWLIKDVLTIPVMFLKKWNYFFINIVIYFYY